MKKGFSLVGIVFCMGVFFSDYCRAEPRFTPDQMKLFEIVQDMEVRKPLPGEKISKEDQTLCRGLLADLKARKNIEFINPIVEVATYDDPKLQAYLGKCPDLALNKTITFDPKIYDYARTLPPDQQEKLGTVWYTTTGFRLYHVDIDNNPANGKEYVFYGAGNHTVRKGGKKVCSDYTDYKVVDLQRCRISTYRQVRDTINCSSGAITGSINGILKHKAHTFFLEVQYYPSDELYAVQLHRYIAGTDMIASFCKLRVKN